MFNTDPVVRARFIRDLRQLADYLDTHPDIPVPVHGTTVLVHADSTDSTGIAQVNAIAEQLGTPVQDDTAEGGHYLTERDFNSVGYRVVAIPDAARQRHLAHYSYSGCVTPDEVISA
jgi:hypothetical protein